MHYIKRVSFPHYAERDAGGQALSRSYGCFFAEFLGEHSLVRLGLLDLTTCVGLGTDSVCLTLEVFLGRLFTQISRFRRIEISPIYAVCH